MPGSTRILLNVPELGVIPAATKLPRASRPGRAGKRRSSQKSLALQPNQTNHAFAGQALDLMVPYRGGLLHAAWGGQPSTPILADRFRATLASLLREAGTSRGCKVIMISSPCEGDGKTTVTANLGIALAEAGRKVLLVDADMRRPQLGRHFSIEDGREGLSDVLQDRLEVRDAPIAVETGIPGLWILPAGSLPENVTQLLYSPQLETFVNRARKEFDVVLFDVPPLLLLADARLIAQYVDGAVLVVRAGQTDRASVVQADQCLMEDGVHLYGTILNDWQPQANSSYGKFYDYGMPR
jgi:capsular exopolysaccharide synthesis family protein